jgi:phosphoserine phosphatase
MIDTPLHLIKSLALITLNEQTILEKITHLFKSSGLFKSFQLIKIQTPYSKYVFICLDIQINSIEEQKHQSTIEQQYKQFYQAILDEKISHELFDLTQTSCIQNLRLITFDMDSTLINIECIDEMAKASGCFEQVSEITERAMQGELDFNESLNLRLSLLKNTSADILKPILERIQLNQGVADFFKYIHSQNYPIKTVLVSGGFDFFAHYIKELLGMDLAIAHQLEVIDEKLTGKIIGNIINADTKAMVLRQEKAKIDSTNCTTMAVGDGANDIKMLTEADLGVAFYAKPSLKAAAKFCINSLGMDVLATLYEYSRYQHTCRLTISQIA